VKLLGEGEQLLVVRGHGVEEAVPVEEVVANKQFVGLYFSAHWCAPPPPHTTTSGHAFSWCDGGGGVVQLCCAGGGGRWWWWCPTTQRARRCPPCRGFTPLLVEAYNELRTAGRAFEVVFVSSDRDAGAMRGYMRDASMPWPAVPFGDSRHAPLSPQTPASRLSRNERAS
jgi:thiol-disulfide isomerase/thioredoxin